ncbi:uncharacterized protein LOC112905668 [Agrilus planipennis]|nr:uncharacterized protein LOC112905668 [Agrilus planipennis]
MEIRALDSKKYVALYKPLEGFLSHLQITFDMAKLLENNLKSNQNDIAANSNIVTAVCNQFNVCNENLHSFVQNYEIIVKRSLRPALKENNSPSESNEELNDMKAETKINKNQDDSIENLEDEEYNLYVGYSDDEEDDFRTSVDYVDQMPIEYLELMLTELKRKLDERKKLKEKRLNPLQDGKDVGPNVGCNLQNFDVNSYSEISSIESQSNCKMDKNEVAVSDVLLPLATPPPPPLPQKVNNLKDNAQIVTTANDTQQPGFLNDIKLLAQQLNRKEDTFGFGSDLSDSDNDN